MNLSPAEQTLQLITWFLALIEFILAFYVLLLNVWHTANRHVSVLLLLLAINNFAVGQMIGAANVTQAAVPAALLAAMAPAANPALLFLAVILLKPRWLQRGRWRWAWRSLYGLALLPILLTLVDVVFGTKLLYTGLNATSYTGGFALIAEYAVGSLSLPVRILNMYVISVVAFGFLLYFVQRDKELKPELRRLAWLLLIAQLAALITNALLRRWLVPPIPTLITGIVFVFSYAYAAFQQMISERRLQKGGLQTRLIALILVVAVPMIVAIMAFVVSRAGILIEQAAVQQPGFELLSELRQFRRISWTVLTIGVVTLAILAWLITRQAFQPVGALLKMVAAVSAGDLTRRVPVTSEDEVGALSRAFNSMTEQLQDLVGSLEQRVAERTAKLERHSDYLNASAAVGHAAASILEADQLIRQVVDLIRERFDLYYVGLFLVEGGGAVLRAGTGEAGQAMLARGHRLQVGAGMIGWSIANAQARIASRAEADAVRLATDELPDTRSEAALPLRSRGRVIGAFTVQSDRSNAFDDPGTIAVLQTMADQVAVALDNARLFTTSQEALETARRAYGELSRQAWIEQLSTRAAWGYRYVNQSVARAEGDWQPEMLRAIQTGQSVQTDGEGEPALAIPIKIRNQVVGTLGLRKAETGEIWTAEETALLEALTEQLGRALESARLYQDTRRRAARERLVGEVTARMRETLDVDTVLQTAVREIGDTLDMAEVEVHMYSGESP